MSAGTTRNVLAVLTRLGRSSRSERRDRRRSVTAGHGVYRDDVAQACVLRARAGQLAADGRLCDVLVAQVDDALNDYQLRYVEQLLASVRSSLVADVPAPATVPVSATTVDWIRR